MRRAVVYVLAGGLLVIVGGMVAIDRWAAWYSRQGS